MSKLIEALNIFLKYGNPSRPTTCEHDELYVHIDPSLVSVEDMKRLEELGFEESDAGNFHSFRYGSA